MLSCLYWAASRSSRLPDDARGSRRNASTSTQRQASTLQDYTDQLQILDALADGITAQDPSGPLVYANAPAARLCGCQSPEELLSAGEDELGARLDILDGAGAPVRVGRVPGLFAVPASSADDQILGLRARHADEMRWMSVTTRAVLDATGEVCLVVNVFHDVTRSRQAEVERTALLDRVQAERAQAEASAENLWAIMQVTNVALSHLALDELLDELLTRVRDTLPVDSAAILLLTDTGDHLMVSAAAGWDAAAMAGVRIALGEGFAGRVAAERRPLALDAPTTDDAPPTMLRASGIVSLAGVPLAVDDRVIGVLQVGSRSARAFENRELGLLQVVADRISYAIERTRLFEREHDALERAEFALDRISRLLGVTAALSGAVTPSQVSQIITDLGISAMGATAGTLVLVDTSGTHLEAVNHTGYPETLMKRWQRFTIGDDLPIAQAVRDRQLVLVGTRTELDALYPHLSPALEGHRSFAAIPLLSEGRSIGALGLSFAHENDFPPVERAFMLSLGQQCAQALERARLYEAANSARAESERARDRIAFLAEASELLGASLDYRSTLTTVARLAVPRISDWCLVEIVEEGGGVEHLTVAAKSEERAALARELRRRYPLAPDAPSGTAAVMRTGRSEIYAEITDEMLAATARDSEHLEILKRLELSSTMIVPIKSGGRVLGAITFASSTRERRFAREDLLFAESLARRAAAAIENSRLYREMEESRERFAYLAKTLQRSLLPQRIAEIPGVEAAVRYRAAAEGTQVGGDFYDLFPTEEGRWAIVMGDVCGKGARAAALTGLARHTIRSVAMLEGDPRVILARLNDAIMREGEDDRAPQFCTVAYATLERDGEGTRLRVSSGGHPLPLLVRRNGSVEKVGEPGLLLGVFGDPEVTEREIKLAPGEAVLFYTDGVIESRRGGEAFGEERLCEVLASCAGSDADAIVDRVEAAVTGFTSDHRSDDIAVLAIRVTR